MTPPVVPDEEGSELELEDEEPVEVEEELESVLVEELELLVPDEVEPELSVDEESLGGEVVLGGVDCPGYWPEDPD